jgi:LmbE family N-acetylglucosaminyl deacetylase
MATLVCFHAHPDDESIATAGVMAKAASEGHRVVLVVATRGEHGEPQPGVLDHGEALWERRVYETHRSAEVLGAERVDFLGYVDSGMMGEPTNDHPDCFWQADLDEAAERLAAILRDVDADVLTVYDDHGGYGHPDHIQVHRVGHRAAELAGVGRVFESTMNRDDLRRMMAEVPAEVRETFEEGEAEEAGDRTPPADDGFGSPEAIITHGVDVSAFLDRKRLAMEAHASQIGPETFFLKMPADAFARAFGTEWFIEPGRVRGDGEAFDADLLDGVG